MAVGAEALNTPCALARLQTDDAADLFAVGTRYRQQNAVEVWSTKQKKAVCVLPQLGGVQSMDARALDAQQHVVLAGTSAGVYWHSVQRKSGAGHTVSSSAMEGGRITCVALDHMAGSSGVEGWVGTEDGAVLPAAPDRGLGQPARVDVGAVRGMCSGPRDGQVFAAGRRVALWDNREGKVVSAWSPLIPYVPSLCLRCKLEQRLTGYSMGSALNPCLSSFSRALAAFLNRCFISKGSVALY